MKWKNIGLKLVTAAMTGIMGLQMTAQPLQASAAATQYLSEVIISYGRTDAEAKNWLTQNGYKVVNQNLNEGGEGGSDTFSWLGLASERRSVYLGFKTTTNPDEAITDMKIMNMNGGYSYEAYEKVLQELEQEKTHFLENIMAALKEYRANYKAGRVKAKIAHDNLNKFKDDDSGQLMGDLLLNTLKTEDEAAWEADPTQHADMVTILMQGNSTVVSEIMQNLAFAADTADDSFVNRAIAAANMDESPFDTFFEAYMAKHPDYTKDEAVTEMMQLYDDDAKMFASSLIGLQNTLASYTQSELSIEASQAEADAYFAEHPYEDATLWASAANLYTVLGQVGYGTSTLLSYLVYPEESFVSGSALLKGYEAFQLPQRAQLYPMIAQMSAGQRSLLEYTAMDRMLTMGLMDADAWSATYATMQDAAFGVTDYETCSVYAEVNRDDFRVGEIAVTNAAQGKAASLGEKVNEGLLGTGISYLTAGIFVGGVATTVAGAALAARNWNTVTTVSNVSLITSEARVPVLDISLSQAKHLKEEVMSMYDNVTMTLETGFSATIPSANLNAYRKYYNQIIDPYLTNAGPNLQDTAKKFIPTYSDDYSIKELTFANGDVYDIATGKIVNDPSKNIMQYLDEKPVNPDLIKYFGGTGETVTEQMNTDAISFFRTEFDNMPENFKDVYENFAIDRGITYKIRIQENRTMVLPSDFTEQEMDDFVEYAQKHGVTVEDETVNAWKQNKKILDQYRAQELAEQYDDWVIADKDQLAEQGEAAMTAGSGSTFWKWFGVGMAIVGLAMSVYSAYAAITEMQNYYHQEMLPIPRKMVDLGYYEDGTHCYIYYDCTKCNRTEMNMGNETLGDYGDLNGDVMKQWLALYTTKDSRAGNPIQAGFTVKKGTTQMPVRTVALSFFGFDYAVNMTDTRFTYNNNANGIYLYYKQLASKYTGTVETNNALVTTGVFSALGGAGVCGLIVALAGKHKKKEPTEAPTAA